MKTLYTLALLLATSAHSAGMYENDTGGATILTELETPACHGLKFVQAHDKDGKPLHAGCWFRHGQSIVVLWGTGPRGQARAIPASSITWQEEEPKKDDAKEPTT